MLAAAVARSHHMHDGARRLVRIRDRAHGVVTLRVEALADVVTAREAQVLEHADGLIAHGLDAIDDDARIGLGMLQRQLEVIEDREPLGSDPGPLLLALTPDVAGEALPGVVEVGGAPLETILELTDLSLE